MPLENGLPSHDTFGDVFRVIDAEAFQRSFMRWVERVFTVTEGQVIAIDGKAARRSHDKSIGKDAIHMVSAWAHHNGITLGQRKVDDKSNEITAIPELLRLLDVTGCIVTIDAIGCQKSIAQTIRDEKADYVLRVKDNQGHLYQDLDDWFAYADQVHFQNMQHDYHQTINKGHGRIEMRRCWTIADPVAFEHIRHYEGWADLQTIVRIERERRLSDKVTRETAYYISSLPPKAHQLLDATRQHWAVENALHWVLDVTFREDEARIRKDNGPQNFGVLRHIALYITQASACLFAPEKPKPGAGKITTDFRQAEKVNKGHGRIEKRSIQTSALLNDYLDWPGLGQVYRLERTFTWLRQGKAIPTSSQVEYGITSLSREQASPRRVMQIRRQHWLIETGLHDRRDVTFREDATRMTKGAAGQILTTVHNLALALIKQAGFHNAAQARR